MESLLLIFLLGLFELYLVGLGVLCFHFHLFLVILKFTSWFLQLPIQPEYTFYTTKNQSLYYFKS